jgi:hypothetical protein
MTTICTSYEAHYYSTSFSGRSALYIIGTGRLWKDSIGKAVFIIDCARVGGAKNVTVNFSVAPGPRLITESLIRFEIENAEPPPDDGIFIGLR